MSNTEPLTAADTAWLESHIPQDGPDRILFAQWIKKKKRNKIEKRIIVITTLRCFTVRRTMIGTHTRRRHASLIDMSEVNSESDNQLIIRFPTWLVEIDDENVDNIIYILLEAYTRVSFGLPDLQRCTINIKPNTRRPDLSIIKPTLLGGFVEMYKAACLKFDTPLGVTESQFLKHIIAQASEYANTTRDGILDISRAPGIDATTGYKNIELKPIAFSAMYNPYIHTLMIRDVKMPKVFRFFSDLIAANTTLKTIILSNLEANSQSEYLASAFDNSNPSLSSLVYLDLSRNRIKNAGASALSKALRAFRNLQTLKLDNCGIGDVGYDEILNAIHSNPHSRPVLKTLNLSYNNKFGERGTKAMTEWLLDNRSSEDFALECLLLTHTGINTGDVMRSIRGSPNLATLDLSGNPINAVDIPEIIKTVKDTSVLNDLRICRTGLKSRVIASIFQPFLRNTSLNHNVLLSASHHVWGQKNTVKFIVPAIAKSVNLQGLFLDRCNLGNTGIIELCKALKGIPTLQALDISNNFARNKKIRMAAEAVADLVKSHQSLLCLRVRGTHKFHLSTDLSVILKAIPESSTLTEIDIAGNRATDNSITSLGWAISHSSTLQALRFDKNEMSLSGFQDLVNNIKQNTSLYDVAMPELDLNNILDATQKLNRYRNEQKLNELKRQLIDHLRANRAGRGRPTFLFDRFYDSPYDDNYPIPSAYEMAIGVGNSYYNKGIRTSSMYDGKVSEFHRDGNGDANNNSSEQITPRKTAQAPPVPTSTSTSSPGLPPQNTAPPVPPPSLSSSASKSNLAPPMISSPPPVPRAPEVNEFEDDLNLDDIDVDGMDMEDNYDETGTDLSAPPPLSGAPQGGAQEEYYEEEYYEEEPAVPPPPLDSYPEEDDYDDETDEPPLDDEYPLPPPPPPM